MLYIYIYIYTNIRGEWAKLISCRQLFGADKTCATQSEGGLSVGMKIFHHP